MTINRFYRFLLLLSPWAIFAGMLQYHFRSFLPAQRLFMGLEFFDFITVADLFVGLLFVVFVIGLATKKIVLQKRTVPVEWKVAIGLLLFAGALQILFQQVYEPVLSTPFEHFRSLFIFPLLLAFMAFRTADEKMIHSLMKSYVAMVSFFCILALIQYVSGWFPGEQYDFMQRLAWPYIDFVTLKSSSANWVAFFVTPLVVLSFVHLFQMLRSKAWRNLPRQRAFWFYAGAFLLSVPVLYLTQSYGGYVAVGAAATFYCFRALPLKKFFLALIALALVAGSVYLHQQTTWKYQVLTGEADYRFATSATSRADIYRMNLYMIATHPLLGTGLNQYQSYFAENQVEVLGAELNESHTPPHAHNFFMSFWTSLGVFGFVGMFLLVLGIFWRTKFDPFHPAVFVLIAIMVHGLIDSYYWKQEIAYFFWLMVLFSYRYRLPKSLS